MKKRQVIVGLMGLTLALASSCSAPQCDRAELHLWNDGKAPAPYRASVKCFKGKESQTLHLMRSKEKIKGCQ